ncbi:MAG: ATP-binding protein [Saprospiraceae bacterium]|nr:ATP-binding protein [Saprospiraceae bacterium]
MFFYGTNNPTPQQLAFLTAINFSVVLAVALIIIKLLYPESIHWSLAIGIPIFTLVIGNISMLHSLRRFIYHKVKLIYKSIHSLKAPKSSNPLNVDMRNHIIDRVEREVIEWAKDWTQQIQNLQKLEKYRRDFIGNVSHELKTPIFNIQGYLYTLLDGGIDDPVISTKYLTRAVDNVERMAAIVSDLGMISKLEGGNLQVEKVRFNIVKLVQEVLEDMELHASQKKIGLEIKENTTRAYVVNADKEMIRQVLINLISNSIKYGNVGGQTLVGFYDLDKNVLIEISDTGNGIAQEHLPRLFERFYRVDKGRARDEGGTGLGLAIVKHIIEAHNQTINVRSREGVGSTFGFTLEKTK